MDRRTALKSMAISVWGMVLLPGCGNGPEEGSGMDYRMLSLDAIQEDNLESLVETLIPKTDTMGAAELNVHGFINRLLANCYTEDFQQEFVWGLDKLENLAQSLYKLSFDACSKAEREFLLLAMDKDENEEAKQFFDLSKEMTILGYTSSEYFLTNFTNYEMLPGNYEGCLPVPEGPTKI